MIVVKGKVVSRGRSATKRVVTLFLIYKGSADFVRQDSEKRDLYPE